MRLGPGGTWYDHEAGPVVRPYAMTRGRTRPVQDLDVVALILSVQDAVPVGAGFEPEHTDILQAARRPISIAELAAHLDLPLGVVRVLIDDLVGAGCVVVRPAPTTAELQNRRLLEAVIDGLRAI
ncbi:DUF742 domain-containing protein [Cryptosporangium aurantiacum]|uniref:DUF742 domain-containing protein n=1 Tax=Cryptosporangium aurantiacum TaxID=134849 RepID=A0A1M7QCI4_9ACTN|nr:DUF742 domain-containing protein [Cryptosporangium aurantiacum]SHN28268.1 Protein of unknown function [Cryptosporangium aurantiacum]